MTLLSFNVNKAAVLRNSRGGDRPSVLRIAQTAVNAGCAGITVHPRPDLRHITPNDCYTLTKWLGDLSGAAGAKLEFNIEGNPFAPANPNYPGLFELVRRCQADQVTLVPDGDAQITSDHGFDLIVDAQRLAPVVAQFRALNARVSVFVDSDCSPDALRAARDYGVQRIEIYTGPYAHAHQLGDATLELQRCAALCEAAQALGLGVNAGHDLNQSNLADLLNAAPSIAEVSIGHALFDDALYAGLDATVRAYLRVLRREQEKN